MFDILISGLFLLGFLYTLIYTPINRFIDIDPVDEYNSFKGNWVKFIYSVGYEIDKISLSISVVSLTPLAYFLYTGSLSLTFTIFCVAIILLSSRFISNSFSLSQHKKVKYKMYYFKHNLWLYLDAVFSTIPFLVIITRQGFQKRLIYNYIMAVDSFELYTRYIRSYEDNDREKIKERMVSLIPLYKNYFKVLSKKMGKNGDAIIKLLDHMKESGSLSVQFLPKSNNFLSKSFKEYSDVFKDTSGVCDVNRSHVSAPYFAKEFESHREEIFGKVIKSTFQDIFGVDLIQLTYVESEVKLTVEYTLIDQSSTFASTNTKSECYTAPEILWSIKLQNSKEVFFTTQIVTYPFNNIKNVANVEDFYNKIAQTHYINLSKELLSEFGISIEERESLATNQIALSQETREELLDSIEENVGEYGEDFLEVVAEEFYNQNEELINTVFMASTLHLAIKHGNYIDIASGFVSDNIDLGFDIGLDSLWD